MGRCYFRGSARPRYLLLCRLAARSLQVGRVYCHFELAEELRIRVVQESLAGPRNLGSLM